LLVVLKQREGHRIGSGFVWWGAKHYFDLPPLLIPWANTPLKKTTAANQSRLFLHEQWRLGQHP
jgi:hypothetical protein